MQADCYSTSLSLLSLLPRREPHCHSPLSFARTLPPRLTVFLSPSICPLRPFNAGMPSVAEPGTGDVPVRVAPLRSVMCAVKKSRAPAGSLLVFVPRACRSHWPLCRGPSPDDGPALCA